MTVQKDLLPHLLNRMGLQCIRYMIPGQKDALVELTGALAGFTIFLGKRRLAAFARIISSVSATLSIPESEYPARWTMGETG